MEGNVLARRPIRRELGEHFVVAKLFTDRSRAGDRQNARLLREVYGGRSLPLYLVLDPSGRERERLEGVATPDAFLDFLRRARGSLTPGR